MFSVSVLFIVIPAMSMDVTCAGRTQEIWDGAHKRTIFFRPTAWFLLVSAMASNCIHWELFSVQTPRIKAGSALLSPASWGSWVFNIFCCSAHKLISQHEGSAGSCSMGSPPCHAVSWTQGGCELKGCFLQGLWGSSAPLPSSSPSSYPVLGAQACQCLCLCFFKYRFEF